MTWQDSETCKTCCHYHYTVIKLIKINLLDIFRSLNYRKLLRFQRAS